MPLPPIRFTMLSTLLMPIASVLMIAMPRFLLYFAAALLSPAAASRDAAMIR